ncbi:MAG: hypothetical protein WDO16_02540 [Bacteroidota bacterium]
MVAADNVPAVGVNTNGVVLVRHVVPPSPDTSKPAGGVTVILPTRLIPDTVYVCAADGVPTVCENGFNVPVTVIDGTGTVLPVTATFMVAAPELTCAIFPL